MPPEFKKYQVLDEFRFSTIVDDTMGIYKAVQLVRSNGGPVEIRVCYYTRRSRGDGSEWWGLSPRPLTFKPEEAQMVAKGILELTEKYMQIKDVIEKVT
jgi:hypothetical protein